MFGRCWNKAEQPLKKFFLEENRSLALAQVATVVAETMSLCAVIQPGLVFPASANSESQVLGVFLVLQGSYPRTYAILALLVCLGVRVLFKVTVIRSLYGLVVPMCLASKHYFGIPLIILALVLVAADVTSIIDYSFQGRHLLAERYNVMKVTHYIGNLAVVILCALGAPMWINVVVYLVLLTTRMLFQFANPKINCLFQASYLTLLLQCILKMSGLEGQHAIPVFLGLAAFSTVVVLLKQQLVNIFRKGQIKLSGSHAHELALRMLRYVMEGCYHKQDKQFAQKFFRINQLELQSDMEQHELTLQTKQGYLQLLYRYVKRTVDRSDWYQLLTLAQLQLGIGRNVIAALQTIARLERSISSFSPLRQVLLAKLKNQVQQQLTYLSSTPKKDTYKEYNQTHRFIQLLEHSSEVHHQLWRESSDTQVIIQQIQAKVDAVLSVRNRVRREYQLLEPASKAIAHHYVCYIYLVERDFNRAKLIADQPLLHHGIPSTIACKFVSFRFRLSDTALGDIVAASSNVHSLLSYDKNEIVGMGIDMLVPGFYREEHCRQVQKLLGEDPSDPKLYNLQKDTVCETKTGEFVLVSISFRLSMVGDELGYFGFMTPLKQSPLYWQLRYTATNELIVRNPIQQESEDSFERDRKCRFSPILTNILEDDGQTGESDTAMRLYKELTITKARGVSLYYKENTLPSTSEIGKGQMCFPPLTAPNDNSVEQYSNTKTTLLNKNLSMGRIVSVVASLLLVLLTGIAATASSYQLNLRQLAVQLDQLHTGISILRRELASSHLLSAIHRSTLPLSSLDSPVDVSKHLQTMKLSRTEIEVYGQTVMATEALSSGGQYHLQSFLMVETYRTIMGQLLLGHSKQSLSFRQSLESYLQVNEAELMLRVFPAQRSYHLNQLTTSNEYTVWSLHQLTIPLCLLTCFLLLLVFQYRRSRIHYQLFVALYQISNSYRKEINSSINKFQELVADGQVPSYDRTCTMNLDQLASFRTARLSFRIERFGCSPRLKSPANDHSTIRMLGTHHEGRAYDNPDESTKPRPMTKKPRKVSLAVLVMSILVVSGSATLCGLSLKEVTRRSCSPAGFLELAHIFRNQAAIYFQYSQFYLKGLYQPQYRQLYRLVDRVSNNVFNLADIQPPQYFQQFLHLYHDFSAARVCQAVQCPASCSQQWQNITIEAAINQNIVDMGNQLDSLDSASTDIIHSDTLSNTLCNEPTFTPFIDTLYQSFEKGASSAILSKSQSITNYLLAQLALLIATLLLLTLPFIANILRSRNRAFLILQLLSP